MTKKILSKNVLLLLLVMYSILMISAIGSNVVYAAEEGKVKIELDGYGTREYPYLISSPEDIDNIREVVDSGNHLEGMWFTLVCDIDFQGEMIEPLADQTKGRAFQGGIDGKGHTISNFVIDEGTEGASFFGRLDGVVVNLNLEGTVRGNVGATFAQDGYGTIINCISGSNIYADQTAAGIVNNWNGTLSNVVFQGMLDATSVFGIVESGNGIAMQSYAKEYKVGNPATIESSGTFDEQMSENVRSELNVSAQQLFFSSDIGKWLNKWQAGANSKLEFSDEVAAFEGTGTENNPFVIDSADKLKVMVDFINAGYTFDNTYLYQTRDIDLADVLWTGLSDDSVTFLGIYDGNGHTISNLNTAGNMGGLFKNFNGKILNLRLVNCHTPQGNGFGGNMGGASLILNSYLDGEISDMVSLENLQQAGHLVNCYIKDFTEPSINKLNNGLTNLVINYGIHCGELYTWKSTDEDIRFDVNYKDIYLAKDRRYWNGSGVEKNPYLISSMEDFVYMRESVYYTENFGRCWFLQTQDIDFSDIRYWRAIADESSKNMFYGNYNGNGYKLLNFHPIEVNHIQSKSIFGNVSGLVFNVHVEAYRSDGAGNGIIANYVAGTGKIFNNVIELSDDSSMISAIGIVNANAGCVLNNLVVRSNQLLGVSATLSNEAVDEKLKTPRADGNQIITDMCSEAADTFNAGIVDAALQMKRRITNFNYMSYVNDTLSLQNPILLTSSFGLSFIKGMLLNNPILLLGILWMIGLSIFIIYKMVRYIHTKTSLRTRTLVQIASIICTYFAFILAMNRLRPESVRTIEALCVNIVMAVILSISACMLMAKIIRYKADFHFKFGCTCIKKQFSLFIVLAIPMIIGMMQLDTPVAYDSDLYYGSFVQAIENFYFSLQGVIDSFSIASKPMHGVAMLMTIGEALAPGTARGVYICNLVLLLLSQLCVYQIIRKLFFNLSSNVAAILSLCYSFSGYVLAGTTYINPDFYSVVTFAIFLWCILFNYKIFAVFSGFLVVCSKPNMIVAYALLGIIFFFYECIHKKMKLSKWIFYTLPATVYLILYFGSNSLNRVGIPAESGNDFIFTIGSRGFQYFAYGFIWIQEIFIIMAIIVLIRNKRFHIFSSFKGTFLFAVWISCFSQLLITIIGGSTLQLCPRYLAVCTIKNILLFAMAMDVLSLNEMKKYVITGTFSVLLFIQLFTTIDPSILVATEVKFDDLHYLMFPKKNQDGNDLTFYNYEYCRDARDGSEILSYLTEDEIRNLYSDSRTPYKMALGSSLIYAVYWDTDRNCRTYIPNENCVRIKMGSIVDSRDTRQQYCMDKYAIILRNTKATAIRAELEQEKASMSVGAFTVYRASKERDE